MKRIGLLVNPYAGIGGTVGLGGSDGEAIQDAIDKGAFAKAPHRMIRALRSLDAISKPMFVVAEGIMGEEELLAIRVFGDRLEVVHTPPAMTTREDTIATLEKFKEKGVDLIMFCGGDGTARDIFDIIGTSIPVVGIPAGVKVHSSVFANGPEAAGEIAGTFLEKGLPLNEREVIDVDEQLYRKGDVSVNLYGTLSVPLIEGSLQCSVCFSKGPDEESAKSEIAQQIGPELNEGIWIAGPGETIFSIMSANGLVKTKLGVDVYIDGELVLMDATAEGILALLEGDERPPHVLVSPIGGQGFIFGRGNQQISWKVLEMVKNEDLVVVATPGTLNDTPILRVDTGNRRVDSRLAGYIKVVVGMGELKLRKVE